MQSLGGERTWVKWNTFFTRWKFPPKFPEILCKWKTLGDCWSKHKSGCLQVFVQYANAIRWNALRLRTTRSVHKSHLLSNQSIVCSCAFPIYFQILKQIAKSNGELSLTWKLRLFLLLLQKHQWKVALQILVSKLHVQANPAKQSRNFLSKFLPFQFNIRENDFNQQLFYFGKNEFFSNPSLNELLYARTTTISTRTSSKNIISRYCSNFVITPSRSEREVWINIAGIKLA